MADTGKGLLVLAGMKPKGDDDSDEDQDSSDEVSPGEESAMSDFEKACADGDHAGMAKALAAFLDIYHGG